jgi:tetratricopeptide (TPR) repeat protein
MTQQTLAEKENSGATYFDSKSDSINMASQRKTANQLLDSGIVTLSSGDHEKGLKEIDQAIAIARDIDDPELEITFQATKGEAIWLAGYLDVAQESLAEALNIANQNYLIGLKCDLLRSIGLIWHESGNPEQGIANLTEAIHLALQSEDESRQSAVWGCLGVVYLETGNIASADHSFRKALELAEKLKDFLGCAGYLTNLGIVHSKNKDPEASISYLRQSCLLFKDSENKEGELNAVELLIGILKNHEKTELLIPSLHRYLTIAKSLGLEDKVKQYLKYLVETHLKLENQLDATSTIEDLLHLLNCEHELEDQIKYLSIQGHLYFDLDQTDQAFQRYQKVLEFVGKGLNKQDEALIRLRIATIAAESKDFVVSEEQNNEALMIANDLQNDQLIADILCVKAINCQEQGLLQKAVSFCQKAISLVDQNRNPQAYTFVTQLFEKLKGDTHHEPNNV